MRYNIGVTADGSGGLGRPIRRELARLTALIVIAAISSCSPIPTVLPSPTLPSALTETPLTSATNTPPPATSIITTALPSQGVATVTRVIPTVTAPPRVTQKSQRKTDFLPPAVQVLVPTSSSAVSQYELVPLPILAADDIGISRVDVFDNNSLASSVNIPRPEPKTFSTIVYWRPTQLGSHIVRIIAYDTQENASQPADLAFVVVTDNRRPFVTITYPLGPQQVEIGTPFTIQGYATDDVGVSRVDLIVDNELVTFSAPSKQNDQTTFVLSLTYVPRKAGTHSLLLRAYDNQGQTSDSNNIAVLVTDLHTPSVAASYEHDSLAPNEPVLISAVAVSQAGISRIELLADEFVVQTVMSQSPALQTSLFTQLVWSSDVTGNHMIQVRAVDQFGLTSTSVLHSIRVREPGESTPSPTVQATPTNTPTLSPTRIGGTPTLAPPKTPAVEITSPGANSIFTLGTTIRISAMARGDGELDRIELWAAYSGEPDAFLLTSVSARGNTAKALAYDWSPPTAGIVTIFARALDIYGQTARSLNVPLILQPLSVPTPAAVGTLVTGKWRADLAASTFFIDIVQIGNALRGAFEETTGGANLSPGFITGGFILRNQVSLTVSTDAPQAILTFDCTLGADQRSLVCIFADTRGRSGSAIFQRVD